MTGLRVHELEYECKKRGIILDPDNKYKSQDYIRLLGQYTLINRYGSLESVPFPILYRFNLNSLMLCKSFKDVSLNLQNDILNNKSKRWIAEYKYLGCRALLIYHPDSGFHFFSREVSLDDFLPIDYTDKIYFINNGRVFSLSTFKNRFPKPFVLDCDITFPDNIDTSSFFKKRNLYNLSESNSVSYLLSLEDSEVCKEVQLSLSSFNFMVFDILYYNGDLTHKSLEERKHLQEKLVNSLIKCGVPLHNSEIYRDDFINVFNKIINNKGEGLVFKNLDKPYISNGGRQSDVQVKLKKEMLSKLKKGIDLDVWISNYKFSKKSTKKDKVNNVIVKEIECSVFIKKHNGDELEHVICNIKNLPDSLAKELTIYDDEGKAKFNDKYFEKVITITGQGLTVNSRFEYAYCDEVTYFKDKNKYSCILLEDDLMSLL